MKKTTYKRAIIIITFLGIILLAIFSKMIYTMLDDQETLSKIPLSEYNNLFTNAAQSKLQFIATTKSRNREPTSSYIYDKRFNVFVLKVVLNDNYNLKSIINYQNAPSHIAMNAFYSDLSNFNMDMKIKAGKSILASTVHFKYSGDFIKSIQENDDLHCYYYKFKTFSINYNNEPYDIIAKANGPALPASLAFMKSGKSLYVIIMTVAEGKEEMPSDLLSNIVT